MIRRMAWLGMAALLASCGEGSSFDKGFKDSFRTKFVENCVTSARANAPPGAPVDKFCSCAADKVMAGQSAKDLVSVSEERMEAAGTQCLAEFMPPGGAAAGR